MLTTFSATSAFNMLHLLAFAIVVIIAFIVIDD